MRVTSNRNGLVEISGLLWSGGHSRSCCQMWTAESNITVKDFKEKEETAWFHHSAQKVWFQGRVQHTFPGEDQRVVWVTQQLVVTSLAASTKGETSPYSMLLAEWGIWSGGGAGGPLSGQPQSQPRKQENQNWIKIDGSEWEKGSFTSATSGTCEL